MRSFLKEEMYLAKTAAVFTVVGSPFCNAAILDHDPVPLFPALSQLYPSLPSLIRCLWLVWVLQILMENRLVLANQILHIPIFLPT